MEPAGEEKEQRSMALLEAWGPEHWEWLMEEQKVLAHGEEYRMQCKEEEHLQEVVY